MYARQKLYGVSSWDWDPNFSSVFREVSESYWKGDGASKKDYRSTLYLKKSKLDETFGDSRYSDADISKLLDDFVKFCCHISIPSLSLILAQAHSNQVPPIHILHCLRQVTHTTNDKQNNI